MDHINKKRNQIRKSLLTALKDINKFQQPNDKVESILNWLDIAGFKIIKKRNNEK